MDYIVITEDERLYLVQSMKPVHEALISKGSGYLDFEEELDNVQCHPRPHPHLHSHPHPNHRVCSRS